MRQMRYVHRTERSVARVRPNEVSGSSVISADRYHDISCGHRVFGHEGKCANFHGHNYRIHFKVISSDVLDSVGRVLDFSVIKDRLCVWVEENWDHKMLLWQNDPARHHMQEIDPTIVILPFNPTAENLARILVEDVGPRQLEGTGCRLYSCRIEETRKCSAEYIWR